MSMSERELCRKLNDIYEMLITFRNRIETLEHFADQIEAAEKNKKKGKLVVFKKDN